MNSLGFIYGGNGQQPDPTVSDALVDPMKALYWYGKSASLGDPNAMGAIAGIYQQGQLAPQNSREAILWYEFASNAAASINKGRTASTNFAGALVTSMHKGSGVEQDKVQAYQVHFQFACVDATRLKLRGDSTCVARNNLANELSPRRQPRRKRSPPSGASCIASQIAQADCCWAWKSWFSSAALRSSSASCS